ncbi:MAG: DNA polymerase III subunit delta' [Xanthomonadales bacterium]|nr:DNA polymerase III subunit delta' [Xanthomonadales bacterium]NIN59650.1 DNA polymerase III subunit delta' [Xanthomonadales bacterium]NIN75063.1 DNA polymerase III subunit delta' [Xanthomonadales bacterium]NIO13397.1 DNA polymerase III subunit delta' [Xanthomonadales bacterium]NIP12043.1 DNA polymerase III subunit delta' [Xanthomonadales bacterium]
MIALPWLEQNWEAFETQLEAGRLAHALLVSGPLGTGKSALADAMAARLLCVEPGASGACGQCRSCQLRAGGAHPDSFRLAPEAGKTQISVDAVRALIERLSLTAGLSPRKVAVIDPADAMNINAANALLKNLEEPPGDTVLILVAQNVARLPVTIRSRCQAISVHPPSREQAVAWLAEAAGVDAAMAAEALEAARGSPLRGLEFISQSLLEPYQRLQQQLRAVLRRPELAAATAMELGAESDTDLVWYWLSCTAADAFKACLDAEAGEWQQDRAAIDTRALGALQHEADRYRALARTPVRQDLLLQDWLIKWAQLTA